MNLPEGLNLFEGKEKNHNTDCVILEKYMYGTVQAARQWAKKFKCPFKELKFEVNKLDPCLMTCTTKRGIVILCIYVVDVLLIGDKESV